MDATKLRLGPANVYLYEGAGTPVAVNIGYLDDGLTLNVNPSSANLTGAQAGTSALDIVLTGVECQIEMGLKEFTLDNIARAMPNAQLIGAGTPTRAEISPRAGLSLRSIAKKLEIRPLVGGVESANSEWITAPIASPIGDVSISYSNTDQRVLNVTFHCFPDDANGGRAIIYGVPPA